MKRTLLSILLSLCATASYAQSAPSTPTPMTVDFLYQQIVKAEQQVHPDLLFGLIGATLKDAKLMAEVRSQAESGNPHAQDVLAAAYEGGLGGLTQDCAQAASWYRKAADQGDADAQYNLGLLYVNGQGVPQDYAQAVSWFRKAADQGDADAQFNLGLRYANGQGVPQDYAQAASWYRKAADQGHASAQLNLGVLYYHGQGVPQDSAQAEHWFQLSAAQVNQKAARNLRILQTGSAQ